MEAGHLVVLPLVPDRVDLGPVGEHAAFAVPLDRPLLPGALPQLVHDLHVLVGHVVAFVMARLLVQADVHRCAVEIGRNDVPGNATFCEVIQRRQATCQQIGVLESHGGRNAEAHVLGDCRHRRNRAERIVHRHLCSVFQGHLGRAAVDVVDANHVGDEQAVKVTALEFDRQVGPVVDVVVPRRLTVRVPPRTRRLVADACHVECVQDNSLFVFHTVCLLVSLI